MSTRYFLFYLWISMKIGLYFGSFNPIHLGHTIIANYITEFIDIDSVWFVVSPQNPLKKKESFRL
ncbi:hypothetical protein [Blattabacterium cuenoti]|uniref:nicotinate-nicotinamide nucleotide adenylyltransferase n=1 Tax=Blattabacterium cuenoti TaxID=1653831 RepID=UPI00312016B4